MGCDIHPYIEVKIGNRWLFIGELPSFRDYNLFSELSNVRGYAKSKEAIGEVFDSYEDFMEAIPNCSTQIRKLSDCQDWHSYTILSYDSIKRVSKKKIKELNCKYFEEWINNVNALNDSKCFDDVRILLWYDN